MDHDRSISIHASIFSESLVHNTRTYLWHSPTYWQVYDNISRFESISGAFGTISCGANIMIRVTKMQQIVASDKRCDRVYVLYICAPAVGLHAACATNSYLKLYRTCLVPRTTISRFTETILYPGSPSLTPSFPRRWHVHISHSRACWRSSSTFMLRVPASSSHLDKYFAQVPSV